MIIGVDNGSCSGAAVALDTTDGSIMGYTTLPQHRVHKKTELDIAGFCDWVIDLDETPELVAVEMPLSFARSSQAMRSMALCYGQLHGVCVGLQWPHRGIFVREWQKKMLGKFPKGTSKEAAFKAAQKLEPDELWLKSEYAKTPHDGIIDAYLIARYVWSENN